MSEPTVTATQFEVPTEPSTIGGVLDTGISLFRSSYRSVVPVATYLIASAFLNAQSAAMDPESNPELVMSAAAQLLAIMPFFYLALMYIVAAVISALDAAAKDELVPLSTHLSKALRVVIPLTLILFLYIICLTIGTILLVIPGIIIGVSMSLFSFVPMIEDRSPWSGLSRSHQLVWGGNWGRTLVVVSVASIISMVLSVISYFGIGAFAFTESPGEYTTTRHIIEGLLGWITIALVMPITLAMTYALYHDLLLRKEGGDLDAKLRDLDQQTSTT